MAYYLQNLELFFWLDFQSVHPAIPAGPSSINDFLVVEIWLHQIHLAEVVLENLFQSVLSLSLSNLMIIQQHKIVHGG